MQDDGCDCKRDLDYALLRSKQEGPIPLNLSLIGREDDNLLPFLEGEKERIKILNPTKAATREIL